MTNARERRRGHGKGRGSPEAVEKRRAARALNSIFAKASSNGVLLDGRAERRRQRLLVELRDGRRGEPLPPIDVLTHAMELLELGESIASIERFGVKPRKTLATPELVDAARRVQTAYGIPDEVFGLIGLKLAKVRGRGRAEPASDVASERPSANERSSVNERSSGRRNAAPRPAKAPAKPTKTRAAPVAMASPKRATRARVGAPERAPLAVSAGEGTPESHEP